MTDYIDRDMLIAEGWHMQRTIRSMTSITIETKEPTDFPAADVVEVVRCKDCKLWSSCLSKQEKQVLIDTNTDGVCEYWMSDGLMPNDFCSYGKRKEDQA